MHLIWRLASWQSLRLSSGGGTCGDISGLASAARSSLCLINSTVLAFFLAATHSLPRCHPEQMLHGGLELSQCAALQSHKGAVRCSGHERQLKLGHRWSKKTFAVILEICTSCLLKKAQTHFFIYFFLEENVQLPECTCNATPAAFQAVAGRSAPAEQI